MKKKRHVSQNEERPTKGTPKILDIIFFFFVIFKS